MKTQKTVGLALGGGAVLGAAHVGVYKALKESGLSISHIAGTSIGAFVGAFIAFGKEWQEIESIAAELKWMDLAGLSLSRYGLLSNQKMADVVTEHLGDCRFEDAHIPLAMIATNVANGEKVVLNSGSVAEAVMASTCIPGIFIPSERQGSMLVDGGIVENVPVNTARNMGAEYVVGVDLNAKNSYEKPGNILEVIMNCFHFTLRATDRLQTDSADLLIKPNLSSYSYSDISQVDGLMQQGYEDAIAAMENME